MITLKEIWLAIIPFHIVSILFYMLRLISGVTLFSGLVLVTAFAVALTLIGWNERNNSKIDCLEVEKLCE